MNNRACAALSEAARWGLHESVDQLLGRGVDVNCIIDSDDARPLSVAVSGGSVRCVSALLDAGADTSEQTKDGNTVLHWLYLSLQKEDNALAITKLLVEHGANPRIKNTEGITAIEQAVTNRYPRRAEYLKNLPEK